MAPSAVTITTNNTNLCYLRYQCSFSLVPTDAEITFADHAGRLYARRYGFAPMVGRLIGYLSLCDPREQTIAELADALLASRSAITGAVNTLEHLGLVHRSRGGRRADGQSAHRSHRAVRSGFDVSEYEEQADLAREGLEVAGRCVARNVARCCWSMRRSPTSWSSDCRSSNRTGERVAKRCAQGR